MPARPTRKRDTLDLDRLRDVFDQHTVESGARVRARRKALGMTLGTVADAIGVTMQAISHIERGDIRPRDYLRAALAITLACEIDELWPNPTRALLSQAAA